MIRDAVVLGAGPAGLSAAIGLRRRGVAVTVHERALRWTARVCGGFLSAEAARHLRWLGVDPAARGAAPVRAVRLAAWFGLDRTIPLPAPGLALPRRDLEDLLAERALAEGARLSRGGEPLRAEALVLAAGRFAGDAPPRHGGGWYGANAVFAGAAGAPGEMTLHFGPGFYVGTLRFSDGTANVTWLLHKDGPADWDAAFAAARSRLPALAALLSGARRASDWHGTGPLPHRAGMREKAGAIAVGDAAAVGDPFFGEGVGRALAAGPMLHAAWAAPDPAAAHRRAWRAAFVQRLRRGAVLRAVLRRPLLLRALLPAAATGSFLRRLPHLTRG